MPNWTGELHLQMEKRPHQTVAKRVYFKGAFKVMRPIYHNRSDYPYYYLLNLGGGYLDGDRYLMTIELEENARLTLTTQSSTKVYKTPVQGVYQEQNFHLKKGSYLEYIPDALIAYQDAKYLQKNNIHMTRDATLIYADILTPGWSPEGAQFSYDTLRLKTDIYVDENLIACDHIKLAPQSQEISGLGFMEGYSHLGTLVVISPNFTDALLDDIYEAIQAMDMDFTFGISALTTPGCTIRVMANYTQIIEAVITESHRVINHAWHQEAPSFLRKY